MPVHAEFKLPHTCAFPTNFESGFLKNKTKKLEMVPGVSHSLLKLSDFVTANISKKKNNRKRKMLPIMLKASS